MTEYPVSSSSMTVAFSASSGASHHSSVLVLLIAKYDFMADLLILESAREQSLCRDRAAAIGKILLRVSLTLLDGTGINWHQPTNQESRAGFLSHRVPSDSVRSISGARPRNSLL
jgi:hypothetical protein